MTKRIIPILYRRTCKSLHGLLLLRLLFSVSFCFMRWRCVLNDSPSAQKEIYQFAALWISACAFVRWGRGEDGCKEWMIPPLTVVRRILVG
jgi:hypothetical protein